MTCEPEFIVTLLNADRLVNAVVPPPIDWVLEPLKFTVPLLFVNVPLLVKLPAKFNVLEVDIRVLPVPIVKLFKETVALPKLRVPAPAVVKLWVAGEMAPPIVSVFAVIVI